MIVKKGLAAWTTKPIKDIHNIQCKFELLALILCIIPLKKSTFSHFLQKKM